VGGIIAFGKGLMGVADEMKNMAEGMTSTMGAMTAMKTLGAENNLNWEEMSKVLGKVRDAQGAVVNLSKTQSDALERLSINANDFVGAGVDQALEMIANAYVKANGSALALNAVNDLFGTKIGPRAIEMLKALDAEGLGPLTERTKEATRGFEELAKAQSDMEKFFNAVTVGAAQAAGSLSDMAKAGKEMVNSGGVVAAIKRFYNKIFQRKGTVFGMDERTGQPDEKYIPGGQTLFTGDADIKKNPDQIKREQNLAAETKKKTDKENEKAQELGRRYYFKELHNQDAVEKLQADYASDILGLNKPGKIKGVGANVDNIAKIGGQIGMSRPGLAAEDRQLRILTESKEIWKDMSAKLQQLIDQQDLARDRDEG